MEEYIKRETAVGAILGEPTDAHYPGWYASILKGLPSADVAPVVHGRWIDGHCIDYDKYIKCSKCCAMVRLDSFFNDIGDWNYCPNCGARCDLDCRARMDGDN